MVTHPGALKCLPTFTLFLSLTNFFISYKDSSLLQFGKDYDRKKFHGALKCLAIFTLFVDLSNFFNSYKGSTLLRYRKNYDRKKFHGSAPWCIKVSTHIHPLLISQ
jgi:hypothetical protein